VIFTEQHQVSYALLPDADRYDSDPATDVYNMELYDHITFILIEGAGGVGTTTLTVEECNTIAGGDNTAIAFNYRLCTTVDTWGALTAATAAGYATVAGANKMVAIEIDAEELSSDHPFVRVQTTELADGAVDAAIIAICSKPRYAQDVMPTSIA